MYNSSRVILFALSGFGALMSMIAMVSNTIANTICQRMEPWAVISHSEKLLSIYGQWAMGMIWQTNAQLPSTASLSTLGIGCHIDTTGDQ